jgi:hypothetical protein
MYYDASNNKRSFCINSNDYYRFMTKISNLNLKNQSSIPNSNAPKASFPQLTKTELLIKLRQNFFKLCKIISKNNLK